MALPGKAGRNYVSMMSGAKRGAFARSPSAAKRGVFAQSPSAAKKGIFAFSPGGGQSSAPSPTPFAPSPRQAEDQSMQLLQQRRDQTRRDFFDNRQDVSNNRLDRRQIQADLYNQFKQDNTKLVPGTTNLYQDTTLRFDTDPMSPTFGQYTRTTLADKATELAMKYGPTFSEIGSDIGYGFSQIGKGLAEKGTPLMNVLKSIYGGVQNFFTPNQSSGTVSEASFKEGLNNAQLAIYNYHRNTGNSPDFARQMALMGKPIAYAMGGVASL